MKYDVVITWVDGDEPEYIVLRNSYAKIKKDLNPERYRDPVEFMKYNLRGISKNLEDYNRIYIVTTRPQCPDWLDVRHPKITLVHHDEFIPENYLPTFNSNVIESFLHKIPGLSEHFLYLCDDYFFLKKISVDDFFRNGKHRIFNTLIGENLGWRIYDGYKDIIGLGLIEHQPTFIRKEFWEAAFALFQEETENTRSSKFRDRKNFFPLKLYRYYMLKYQKEKSEAVLLPEVLRDYKYHRILNNPNREKKYFDKLKKSEARFVCLNDDMRDKPDPQVLEIVQDFLNEKFPEKSDFELD